MLVGTAEEISLAGGAVGPSGWVSQGGDPCLVPAWLIREQ